LLKRGSLFRTGTPTGLLHIPIKTEAKNAISKPTKTVITRFVGNGDPEFTAVGNFY
jgi:hypothetical protein